MRKKTLFLAIAVIVFSTGSAIAETAINMPEVNIVEPKRSLYYNTDTTQWYISDGSRTTPIDFASNIMSTFGISVPVKNGDVIEVAFQGSVHGNACCVIECLEPSSSAIVTESRFKSVWQTSQQFYTTEDIIWNPFTVKSVYAATATTTLRFRLHFWQEPFNGLPASAYENPLLWPSRSGVYKNVWIQYMMATAEVIRPSS